MVHDVRAQTYLLRRGGRFHYQRRVPLDLRTRFQKAVIRRPLHTSDFDEAKRLVKLEAVRDDEEFQRLRSLAGEPPRKTITDEEIASIVGDLHAAVLDADEATRMAGLTEDDFSKLSEELEEGLGKARSAVARGAVEAFRPQIQDWLWAHRFDLDEGSDGFRRFGYAWVKALLRARQDQKRRNEGELVQTPAKTVREHDKRQPKRETLMDLYGYWEGQAPRGEKIAHEFKFAVKQFEALNGVLPASEIKKAHVVAFKDYLVSEGKARATVKKQLSAVAAILELAVTNDKLPTNVARGVRLPKVKVAKKPRIPFSVEDLQALFATPVFRDHDRPSGGAGEAAYWLPVLALYTGARLGELGQLRVRDALGKEGGVSFLNITDEHEGAKVKAASSRRKVPIHPQLAALGFMEYVSKRNDVAGMDGMLFPDLKPDNKGVLTGNFSKWFGRYLRGEAKVADRRKTFHSFRHLFKDVCRVAGVDSRVHDRLTGHSNGNTGDGYGGDEFPLEALARATKKVKPVPFEIKKWGGR